MQGQKILMVFALLVLIVTITMVHSKQLREYGAKLYEKPIFSLRDLLEMTPEKRINVHMSCDL